MSEELDKKLKTASVEELLAYKSTARGTSFFIDVFGVSIFLVMLNFTGLVTLIPGAILLYISAVFSQGIRELTSIIDEALRRKTDK